MDYVALNAAREELEQQVRIQTERVFYHGNVLASEPRFCGLLTVAGRNEYTLLTTDPISELWLERNGVRFLLQPISRQEFERLAGSDPLQAQPLYYCVDNLRLAFWPAPDIQYRLGWYHVPINRVPDRGVLYDELSAITRSAFRTFDYDAANNYVWLAPYVNSPEAESKSIELLKSWLTPKQRKQFDKKGSFDVTTRSGKRYRIKNQTPYNVVEMGVLGAKRELCFVPTTTSCIGDVMLAQKIMLETDERGALAIANVK